MTSRASSPASFRVEHGGDVLAVGWGPGDHEYASSPHETLSAYSDPSLDERVEGLRLLSGMFEGLREAYRRDGFVVVRGLLEVEEAMALRQRLVEHSGVTDADFDDVEDGVPRVDPPPAWLGCRPSSICSSMSASLALRVRCSDPRPCISCNDLLPGYSSRDGTATTSTAPSAR